LVILPLADMVEFASWGQNLEETRNRFLQYQAT